jgi:hypothetical protein
LGGIAPTALLSRWAAAGWRSPGSSSSTWDCDSPSFGQGIGSGGPNFGVFVFESFDKSGNRVLSPLGCLPQSFDGRQPNVAFGIFGRLQERWGSRFRRWAHLPKDRGGLLASSWILAF